MSEQTPGQPEHDSVVEMGDAEPSMEDILASIRKIIADDVDPVPLDGPSDVMVEAADVGIAPVEVKTDDPFDIDALLGDMAPLEAETTSAAVDASIETSSELTADDLSMDAFDDLIDLEIPVIPDEPVVSGMAEPATALGATIALGMLADPAKPSPAAPLNRPKSRVAEVAATSDDDMDGLMDELLADLDMADDAPAAEVSADFSAETVFDPAADLLESEAASNPVVGESVAELASDPFDDLLDMDDFDLVEANGLEEVGSSGPSAELVVPQIEESEDLDLVKSLMEDLTDEDTVALEAELEVVEPEIVETVEENDVLDDILNMTLEDEIEAQPLEIPEMEPELEPVAELAPVEDIVDVEELAADPVPSLADIAASAQSDADAAQSMSPAIVGSAAVAGAALAGGAVASTEPEPVAPIAGTAVPAAQPEPTPEPTPMETPMPRAVRSEAILDEVTEEATMSAFAELNNVVEEKAVYSERGPRIGDLVSEALKPMLKEWLDANLKGIVERAVAKEVKRISTGK